jgi:hypothetical protein
LVQYTTRGEFGGFVKRLDETARTNLRDQAEKRSPQGATFLSHSSKDDDLVSGAVRILEIHGASVYLDKKDPELPPYTNKDTAATLRSRIEQSKKFVLLASENSRESKWVPWELGIADGYKNRRQIALFPAVEATDRTAWTSWEYLGLYDHIVWGKLKGYEKNVWMVWDDTSNTATELSKWLKG